MAVASVSLATRRRQHKCANSPCNGPAAQVGRRKTGPLCIGAQNIVSPKLLSGASLARRAQVAAPIWLRATVEMALVRGGGEAAGAARGRRPLINSPRGAGEN